MPPASGPGAPASEIIIGVASSGMESERQLAGSSDEHGDERRVRDQRHDHHLR